MDPTFAHPKWIVAGILLILGGLWLFRWAQRNNAAAEITAATTEAAINKLLKNPGSPSPAKKRAAANFRNAMSQFFGIVGFLMMIAGLVALVLGIFYVGG
jgi:predicted negative regulator of RcsB-dependent stress response